MKSQRFILIIACLLMAFGAWAEVSFTLVPPRRAIEGQKFTITFRVANGASSAPKAPEIEGCQLLYGPSTSTMQSTQIINGKASTTSTVDYTFTYLAQKAGTVKIPAVSVSIDGKPYSTKATDFTILPPDQSANAGGRPAASPAGTPGREFKPDEMFVRISLNKSSVYEQEAVVATVKVYTQYEISSFQITAQPTFEGFLAEELQVPSGVEMEHYNGKNYYTAYLKKVILFPQKAGKLTITSGKYEVTLVDYEIVSNGFFQTRRPVERQISTQSNSASLSVTALPEPKPEGFNGAVGSFTAQAEMHPLELSTNEATSYNLTISGSGNLKYLKTPALKLPAGIDEFTPKTDINANFNGSTMQGTYAVNYTLVPQEPGKFEIPSAKFSYFDLGKKEYKTISLPSFELKVAQGASVATGVEQKAIAKGMTDILHIKPAESTLALRRAFVFHSFGYWALYALLLIALIAIILIYRRQVKLNADVRGRKLARANKQAAQRLKAARQAMGAHDSEKFYKALNSAMWGYLSDKLGIPSSQLTRSNITTQLANYGLAPEGIDDTITVLDECEMARFTPEHSDAEMNTILKRAEEAIRAIERVKN